MTREHEARRTLVKSPPELWAECSHAGSLARHLGEFGEIRITKLEPETSVAWEGEHASGTVQIEPSGWGTKVTLTAQLMEGAESPSAPADVEAAAVPDEVPGPDPAQPEPVEAEAAIVEEPEAVQGDAVLSQDANSIEEDNDATLEETPEAPDLAVADDPAAPRWRRRRLKDLIRSLLKGPEEVPTTPAPSTVASSPEPAGSIPPPAPRRDEVSEGSLEAEPERQAVPQTSRECEAEVGAEVERVPEVDPHPLAAAIDADAVLTAALDSLGRAHHRPFSRA
jgi:hypothetical protein